MKSRIYIETSVASFYYEIRTEPEMIARRDWTRQFWDMAQNDYSLLTSVAVMEELEKGEFPNKEKVIELIKPLRLLPIESEIEHIVEFYIEQQVMPGDPTGDALHLAIASYHKCDFLLTWNCKHLANANKFGQIRRVNAILGLFTPMLVTPLELLGEST